jgi:hypothetical protein
MLPAPKPQDRRVDKLRQDQWVGQVPQGYLEIPQDCQSANLEQQGHFPPLEVPGNLFVEARLLEQQRPRYAYVRLLHEY